MTRFIVIGASGLIGGRLFQELTARGCQVIGTCCSQASAKFLRFDMTESSILDLIPDLGLDDAVYLLGARVAQNWIFHHPQESHDLNVVATCRCIDDIMSRQAALFFLSSESVFDGNKNGYKESDTPNPLSLYAQQKVEVERHLLPQRGDWCLMRTGWNEGMDRDDRGVIATTYIQLLSESAKIANDNILTVNDSNDTVEAMIELADHEKRGVYHLASNPPLRRTDIADLIINESLFGDHMNYESVAFSTLKFDEPKSANTWLRNDKAVSELGVRFKPATETIKRKVAQLDANFAIGKEAAL